MTIVLVIWWATTAAISIWNLTTGASVFAAWIGLAIASLAPLSFVIWERFLSAPDRPLQPLGFSILCGLGLAIAMTTSWRFGPAAGVAHIGAGASLIGWATYLRWLRDSRQSG